MTYNFKFSKNMPFTLYVDYERCLRSFAVYGENVDEVEAITLFIYFSLIAENIRFEMITVTNFEKCLRDISLRDRETHLR